MMLVYAGPSLPLEERPAALEGELWLAPGAQGDIASHVEIYRPQAMLLIDGEFSQNLSVWHKEILFAMSEGIQVVGASSMGAIRAADLDRHGMIGVGTIYEWYRDGVTEDDSEVALLYEAGSYRNLTVPLCNVRATLGEVPPEVRAIHYSERYPETIAEGLGDTPIVDQKRLDALAGLAYARVLASGRVETAEPLQNAPEMVESAWWKALYAIDRKIVVSNGTETAHKRVSEVVAERFAGGGHLGRFNDVLNEMLALEYAQSLGLPKTQAGLAFLRGALLTSRIPMGVNLEILDYMARINDPVPL
jgi:hypothetical protein